MKHWLLSTALICFGSVANASLWTGKLGLDASSIGSVVSHDFLKQATVSGFEWDALHIRYNSNEVGELGLFVGSRDTDKKLLLGPSIGTSGMNVGKTAKFLHNFFDWPILGPLEDAGNYVNAYFNFGVNPLRLKDKPFLGLGGILKFGGK